MMITMAKGTFMIMTMGMKLHKQISLCEQHYNIVNNNLYTLTYIDILKAITIVQKVTIRFKIKIRRVRTTS